MLPDRGKVLQPELLRSMLDAANDLIFAKDRDGHYLVRPEKVGSDLTRRLPANRELAEADSRLQ